MFSCSYAINERMIRAAPLKTMSRIRRRPFHHHHYHHPGSLSLAVSSMLNKQQSLFQTITITNTNTSNVQTNVRQARTFFSFFKPERTEAVSPETWTRVSTNLLTSKVGSLSRVKWQEALEALEYWTKQRTKQGLTWSWRVFDRLVDEEAFLVLNKPNEELLLTHKHLGMLVGNWSQSANMLSAKTILDRLDRYHALLPHFQPNVRILGALLTGALKKRDARILDLVDTVMDRLERAERHPLSESDMFAIEPALRATTRRGYLDSPARADAILQRLRKLSSEVTPDQMQGRIMSHLAKSDRPGAALQVESMLKDLVEPTTAGYISVLQAWSRSEDEGAADRCYAILNHMKSQDRIKATARCYTPVITAFGREQRPQEAEAVLQELLEEYERTKDPLLLPSVFPFNALIHAWSISGASDAGIRAETLLQRMSDLAKLTNNPSLEPDKVSFTAVISAWAYSYNEAGAERAEQILLRMNELHQQGKENLKPDTRAFAVTMEAWQRSGSPSAVDRTQALFNKMVELHEAGDYEMAPSLRTFTVLLETMVVHKVAPERLDAVIRDMQSRAEAGNPSVQPTTPNYKCAMEAWGSSSRRDAPERMEALLRGLHNTGRKADRHIYSLVLHAWATSRLPDAMKRVDAILALMHHNSNTGQEAVTPTIRIYNIVLKAYSNSRSTEAPRRANAILLEIGARRKAGEENLIPNTMTYNLVMSCWLRYNPVRTSALLDDMISEYKAGNEHCKPDETSYNHVINAWSRSSNESRTRKAADIFHRMEHDGDGIGVKTNGTSYILMIYSCFRDREKEVGAAAMARGYLERMINLCEVDKSFMPSYVCFNQVIVSMLQSDQPYTNEHAVILLDRLQAMEKSGHISGRKDRYYFSFLLAALAQSTVSSKLSRIHSIMKDADSCRIQDLNEGALHCVLEACASNCDTESDDDTIQVMKDVLAKVTIFRDVTFVLVFKALATMHGREDDVRMFYSLCVQHGYMQTEDVLKAYNNALEHNQRKCIQVATQPL
jgi:hypothetical protein